MIQTDKEKLDNLADIAATGWCDCPEELANAITDKLNEVASIRDEIAQLIIDHEKIEIDWENLFDPNLERANEVANEFIKNNL